MVGGVVRGAREGGAMNRYKVQKMLGDGTYGCVWRAVNRQTNEVVAIKKMKRKVRRGAWGRG